MKHSPRNRGQRLSIIYGILSVVVVLVVMQLWLLTATMNAFLGANHTIVWPAALASITCFGLNVGLLRYLIQLDR
jgi:uncharacterized membrane-anchored protein